MDYETPDGSQFSLREIWSNPEPNDEDSPKILYTSISANVDGRAYFGRLDERTDAVDEGDVLSSLEAVPGPAIYPLYDQAFTRAPPFDSAKHYLKAPSFTWDDCQPGVIFVADCFQNEIQVFERLKKHRHPNIVRYYGCVVKDDRVTHISLEKCQSNIREYIERAGASLEVSKLLQDVRTGIDSLHSLGLAHNDINPENICVVENRAVIVDFDGCMPFGQELMKGTSVERNKNDRPISAAMNDIRGLEDLEDLLESLAQETAPNPSN